MLNIKAALSSVRGAIYRSAHAPDSMTVINTADVRRCHNTAAVFIVPKEDADSGHVSAAQFQPPRTIQQKAIHIFEYSSICNPSRPWHVAEVF